ncbi:MAG: TonB-dependent receptor [Mucilaginibacter sp.]|nr:TonB-dependent receptor [Mucilaginibacter sp.]
MKITFLSIALLVLFSLTGYAQSNYAVKGVAVDTSEKKTLSNTSIMVLNAKDSVLRKFTRAAGDGSFSITGLEAGKFILVMTYPDYADYTENFTLDEKQATYDFGKISLILKSRLLKDVIIKGQTTAIKIKGDTTEFNAKAYVIQPNDRVEDLIKQFPGIQVDKDGKITAQGKTVEKVLVDGEEFFGDDPTLVTKNLRADMVDKVQLYDKKSDQATFTGIDDGVKTKTLNIKLKEDKKNGYFGKVDAGIGNRGFYQGQGMYNRFTAKQKFAAYTTDANTGKTGLSWNDNTKYGDSGNVSVDENGGVSIFFSGADDGLDSFSGNYDGRGIPKATTGGFHYDVKWGKDNQSLNVNYKIGQLNVDGASRTQTQNNQQDNVFNSDATQNFNNSMFRQKLDFIYQVKLDTTATLKITADGTYKNGKTNSDYNSTTLRSDSSLLNTNKRKVTNDEVTHLFNTSVFYTKKLKKKGRTFSALFSEAVNNADSKGYLHSNTGYYNTSNLSDSARAIDQYNTNIVRNTVFNSNLTYTEPLSKSVSLSLNYGFNINNGTTDRRVYKQSSPGVYNVLDDTLSNNYKLNQLSNQLGLSLNYKTGKSTLNFGTQASDVAFTQTDQFTDISYKRHFINWNPHIRYQYKPSTQSSLYFNYYGYTSQPTINQIQPVKNNTDPLNILLGNPGLDPSFTHSVNLYYYSYKVLSGQDINFGAGYSQTANQITNNTSFDATSGKSTTQYVNLSNKTPYNYNFWGSIGRKISPLDVNVGLDLNLNGSKSYGYTNNLLNSSTSNYYSGSIRIGKYVKDKFDISGSIGPHYSISKSSLQTQVNNNGGGFNTSGYFTVYLPAKISLSSNIDYNYTAKTATFNNDFKVAILNASISKAFFKDRTLNISISGNDLLDQNRGISRNAYNNLITQDTYTTIKRYFMCSVIWDFNVMGGSAVKK